MSDFVNVKRAAKLPAPAGDDAVIPFAVESLSARGRAARLGPQLDALIKRHNYPAPAAGLLAQAAALTALLAAALKFRGRFIMQTQTDGAVNMLVCDYVPPERQGAPAALRAHARFDEKKLAALSAREQMRQERLLGAGTMAFTVDQGAHMQLYQGIVPLDNMNLEQAAQQYFAKSEQIPTKVRLASAALQSRENGVLRHQCRAGGLLAQYLPQSGGQKTEPQTAENQWRETELLTATVTDDELTDPNLSAEQLLYRLFHEQGARVFPAQKIADKCSCSRQKLLGILAAMPEEERAQSAQDGKITAKCQFCSAEYVFSPREFAPHKQKA